ncbi:MAG: hypothetical protein ACLSB9_35205 [Hydrogeniiclostridium mannosilyticum]
MGGLPVTISTPTSAIPASKQLPVPAEIMEPSNSFGVSRSVYRGYLPNTVSGTGHVACRWFICLDR